MIEPFKLERYFAQYEFTTRYLLSPSDVEALGMSELLDMADEETRRLWAELRLAYTESPGHPLLRQEVAALYARPGAQGVMVAAPEEAVFVAMHALLRPGDQVIAVFPAYQSLYEVARSIGCQVLPWRLGQAGGGWRLDLDWLEGQVSDRTRLIVVNFPHNPTGLLPSLDDQAAIVSLARKHGAYLFSDEMYRLLEYVPSRRLPPACDLYERAVSLSGLSKTFALPGLRLGWLASQDRGLLDRCLAFKDYTTICSSAPSEILGIIALRAKERIVRRSLDIIAENLRLAAAFFAEFADRFEWLPPQAGSVAFPRWLGPGPVEAFCQEMLDRQGVMIVPGGIFDYPGPHFRIGLGRRNFAGALGQVKDYLTR